MIDPMFGIKGNVFQNKQQWPVQEGLGRQVDKMKLVNIQQNEYVYGPEQKINTPIERTKVYIHQSILQGIIFFHVEVAQ